MSCFIASDKATADKRAALEEFVSRAAAHVSGDSNTREGLTHAQLGVWYAQSLSFFSPVGTGQEVSDRRSAGWWRACDGFVVLPAMPVGADDLLDRVAPELQGGRRNWTLERRGDPRCHAALR